MPPPRPADPPSPRPRAALPENNRNTEAAPEVVRVARAGERFVSAIHARSMALTLKLDLTMPQLRTLITIRHLGRANGRQLGAELGITPGAVVAVCDHLEQRGYVRRVTDPIDRRITWFEPTRHAIARLEAPAGSAMAHAQMKALIAGLTPCEREGFVKIANGFADALTVVLHEMADE
jgi:DNA-binding MarR family transcriptional regulator